MTPELLKLPLIAAVILLLFSGCVVVINNKPTTDEQALLTIQEQATQEVSTIGDKIKSGSYSMAQVQGFFSDAKKVFDENLQKIAALKTSERSKDLAEKTKQYLESAQKNFESLMQMSSQAGTKMQDLLNNFQTIKEPLLEISQQIEKVKNGFLKELKM